MSETHQYLQFKILSSDLAFIQAHQGSLVTDLGTAGSGNGIGAVLMSPDDAAIKYASPKVAAHAEVVVPGIVSEWFGTEDHFPTNVATFDRKSGGWFGWPVLFGDTTHYHWRGIFIYIPPATLGGGVSTTMLRRWIDGFEVPGGGEGGSGVLPYSKEASRHVQGLGMQLRNSTTVRLHSVGEMGGAASVPTSWERFYIRLRTPPAAPATFWRCKSSLTPAVGAALQMSATGQITINSVDNSNNLTFVAATTPITLDVWHKIDLVFLFAGAPADTVGGMSVFIDGALAVAAGVVGLSTAGSGVGCKHVSSEIGGTAANTMALDVDDWMNAVAPASTNGVDFVNGSAMLLITPTVFDAATTPAAWTGDVHALEQLVAQNAPLTVSSASAAVDLVLNTDAHQVIAENPENIGIVALLAMIKATVIQAGNSLGFVGADLTSTLEAAGSAQATGWQTFLWKLLSSAQGLKPDHPINLVFRHGGAGATAITNIFGECEMLGIFGPEDAPNVLPKPKGLAARLGAHNSPYPSTPWARQSITPIQPVLVVTGTYVGNGVAQDLTFEVPVHLFRTRPLTAEAGGAFWFSTMVAPHKGVEQQNAADHLVYTRIDPAFVPAGLDTAQQHCILSIVGADAQSNANGVTYAYVAVCDPGMRFLMNANIKNHRGTVDMTTVLPNPTFTPKAGIAVFEAVAGSTNPGMFFKGVGHLAQSMSAIGAGGEITNAWLFSAGLLTNRSSFNSAPAAVADTVPVALFRTDDGGAGDIGKVFQVFTYTGDGNVSRSIACTPVSGKRPMWAIVVPHTVAAIYRDPYHTGTTSSTFNAGQNAATGITAGDIDSISVGSALNALGVVYDVLVIPGDVTAGNNGWSIGGSFMPVSPDPPPGAVGDPDAPQEPPDKPVIDPIGGDDGTIVISDPLPPAGPMPSLTDDLDPSCILETTRMINIALTRIGVTTQIGLVASELTPEASAVRLLYNDAIQETLRDFAWPFATRYVQLAVLNTGTRPNSDWRYAYRQPPDCIFERRIVVSRADVADAAPIPFACSSDDTGQIIFTNLANAILEYTARPKCPHTRGEPLFREAAAWKLAELAAPSLARITDAAVNCAKGYAEAIGKAQLVLRPGNPGDVPATSTLDTTTAQLAANLQVINLALVRIGARTIRNFSSDQSREAQVARIVFEQELRATLRDFPWAFATQYAALSLVGGTTSVPVNADWQYSYRLPADVVFVRRLVDELKRAYERQPNEYRTAKDGTGGLLFTDMAITTTVPVTIEYTNRPAGAVAIADDLFRDALAWRMAWTMAPSLAVKVPEEVESFGRGPDDGRIPKERPATGAQLRARAADTAQRNYYRAISTAEKQAANEGQPDLTNPDADWIAGRE